jgi:hypothetical protein
MLKPIRMLLGLSVPLIVSIFSVTSVAESAQLPPVKPAPLSKQVPQGEGACSVGKSCAELAPVMEQKAMGASPLEENLRYLSDSIGGRVTGTPAADRAAGWAVQAFRNFGT